MFAYSSSLKGNNTNISDWFPKSGRFCKNLKATKLWDFENIPLIKDVKKKEISLKTVVRWSTDPPPPSPPSVVREDEVAFMCTCSVLTLTGRSLFLSRVVAASRHLPSVFTVVSPLLCHLISTVRLPRPVTGAVDGYSCYSPCRNWAPLTST